MIIGYLDPWGNLKGTWALLENLQDLALSKF